MRISIFGAGYVGLTTAAVLAELGHDILLVERVTEKITRLQNGLLPFYEPGLDDLVQAQITSGRLTFTNQLESAKQLGQISLICVGTPPLEDGAPDLRFLESVLANIAALQPQGLILITKSSVPPGTNAWLASKLCERGITSSQCLVVSNPEFLREGTALEDTRQPSRIVFGFSTQVEEVNFREAITKLHALYAGIDGTVLYTTWEAAELIKYASNAFLACKISFANELARICDAYAADIRIVTKGIGMDPRIGPAFLGAGLGYGGSCLPKDLAALTHAASEKSIDSQLFPAIAQINDNQIFDYAALLIKTLSNGESLNDSNADSPNVPRIAVWGISFKPDTDDTRMSPAVNLIYALATAGLELQIYDPVATLPPNESLAHAKPIAVYTDPYAALEQADALVVCTEWRQFHFDQVDWEKVRNVMRGKLVLDTRNLYSAAQLDAIGLVHLAFARPKIPDFLNGTR